MNTTSRRVHGGEVLGATPGHPLLVPALSAAPGLSMSPQQGLLDRYAVARIPGCVGLWPADPAYLYEDSAGTIPASVGGVVGQVKAFGAGETLGPELVDTLNTLAEWIVTPNNTLIEEDGALKATYVDSQYGGFANLSAAAGLNTNLEIGGVYLLTGLAKVNTGILNVHVSNSTGTSISQAVIALSSTTHADFAKFSVLFTATAVDTNQIRFYALSAGETIWWKNLSVKRVLTNAAIQTTTANKPYLRKTPQSGVYWLDSNTSTLALNVALSDTVLGRRNLLTSTPNFLSTWAKTRTAVTANATTASDGTTDAVLFYEDTSTNSHFMTITACVVGVQQTITLEVKADARSTIAVKAGGSANTELTFNASTNTFSSVGVSITAYRSELLNDGWYKLVFTCVPPLSASLTLSLINGTASYTGDGVSGIYLSRPQLELGATATDYQRIVSAPAYCTVARATAEGVTFTENSEITASYNIAPAYGFNGDIAIFNRALTTTEKALLTRYMQRGVPIIGPELFVNRTFDTDTNWAKGSNWTIDTGAKVATKTASAAQSQITQTVAVIGKAYLSSADLTIRDTTLSFWNGASSRTPSVTGTYSAVYVASATSVGFRGGATSEGDVDNASLKEIL